MMILTNNINLIILVLGILFLIYIIFVLLFVLFIDRKYFNKRIVKKDYINYQSINDFKNLKKEAFTFYVNKNKLNGDVFYYNEQCEKVLIFACGFNVEYEKYLKEIDLFASIGYKVYTYNNTGCGKSEGKTFKGMPQAIIDIENCIKEVKKLNPNSEIVLVGHSMGGYAVCNVLNLENVNKVIAIAPFNHITDVVKDNSYNKIGKNIFLFTSIYKMILKIKFKKYASYKTFDTLKYVNTKVLVIHGMNDKTVKVDNCINSMMSNTNVLINYLILDNKTHDPLLSSDAINYNLFLKHQLDELKFKYKKTIPSDELKLINENINYDLKTKFDNEVINEVKKFLNEV